MSSLSQLSLNNTESVIADSIHLIVGNELKNIFDIFATIDDLSNVTGFGSTIINNITSIANQIPNNTNWYQDILDELNLKAYISQTYSRTYIDNLIANYYNKDEVNAKTADKQIVNCAILNYTDVSNTGANTLIIKGSTNISFINLNNVGLMDMSNTMIDINKNLTCHGTTEFIGDCIIPNHYDSATIDFKLANLSNTILSTNSHVIRCAKIEFLNVNNVADLDYLHIKADNVKFSDASDNTLINLTNQLLTVNLPLQTYSSITVNGDLSANNIYTKANVDDLLLEKRDVTDSYGTVYLDNELNSKQNLITGSASTITSNNLTANKVVVSNNTGKVDVSTISTTELGYLSGLSDNITTLLNAKRDFSDSYGTTHIDNAFSNYYNSVYINANYYNKGQVDDKTADKAVINTSMINFVDVLGTGTNVLTIKGGHSILFQGSNEVDICNMLENLVSINVDLIVHGETEFKDDCIIPNHYNKNQIDNMFSNVSGGANLKCEVLEFDNIPSDSGTTELTIKGGVGINFKDENDVNLFDMGSALIQSHKNFSAPNIYTKTEVNNLNKHTTNTSKINFMDVDSTGETILKIIGDNTSFKTSSDVALFDMSNTIIESKKNMKVNGTLEVTGDCDLHNVYTKFEINGFLAAKRAISNSYSTNDVDNFLSGKQNTIADGDLTIAKTNGLQTALNAKQDTIGNDDLSIAMTAGLQTALNGKQNTIADGDLTIAKTAGLQTALDNAGSDITVTANRALISDGDGKVAVSDITNTELGYLDGVVSNIQTQLNGKIHESQVYTKGDIDDFGFQVGHPDITGTEISYLDGVTSNIQTQLNGKIHESQVYTKADVDDLIANINTSFYYLLRYDYEGELFYYISDPKLDETPDIEVDTNLFNLATNIRSWVLLLDYNKQQDLVQLQTLYNNANGLVKNHNDNTLFTFLATLDKYFLNWFYSRTLRNSDLFGALLTSMVNSFLSYVDPTQNATILNLSPQLNRYFPLVNDLKDYTDTYTFPSNTVFAGIDTNTMSYESVNTQGDLLIDLDNEVSDTNGKIIKHGFTTECWVKFLVTQTTDSDFLKIGYANAHNQTSNGSQAVLCCRSNNSSGLAGDVYIKLTDGGSSIEINKADNPKFNIDRWMHIRVFIQDKKWYLMIFQDNKMFESNGLLTNCYGIHDLHITSNSVTGCSYLLRDLAISNGREYETGDDYYSNQKRLYWLHSVISPRTGVNLEYVNAFLFITPTGTEYNFGSGLNINTTFNINNTTVTGLILPTGTLPAEYCMEFEMKPSVTSNYYYIFSNHDGSSRHGVEFYHDFRFSPISSHLSSSAPNSSSDTWTQSYSTSSFTHIKFEKLSTGVSLYINDVLKGSLSSGQYDATKMTVIKMASYGGAGVHFQGKIKNIKVYEV